MDFIIAITGFILTVFFIVGIHEFGHFIVARAVGIKVLRFSIGFGKTLLRWSDKKGTEYALSAIPLGGYVKMLDETEGHVPADQKHLAYNYQPIPKRLAVIFAGPLFNFIFAFFIYWCIFIIGFQTAAPVIIKVEPNSIAASAGLTSQDEIIKINQHETISWSSVIIRLSAFMGDSKTVTIETKNLITKKSTSHTLDLTHWQLDELEPDPLKSLGIIPFEKNTPLTIREIQYKPIQALFHAAENTIDFIHLNFLLIGKMLIGKISVLSLGGPLTIVETAGNALTGGVTVFFGFLAFLSIAIGAINLIPIPGLDGGHLLFYTLELILQRPLSQRVQLLAFRLGLILLALVLAQAIANDLMRLQ